MSYCEKIIEKWVYTTCGYCSVGCGIEVGLNEKGKAISCRGIEGHPVNNGKLCCKGITEYEVFDSKGRGLHPMMRKTLSESFQQLSWDKTLDYTVSEFKRIQNKYGKDALAVVSTGQLYTEEFYTLGKLVRGGLGTNNYDGNTALCMASAVSGYKRSFGSDGPPGCYEDFEKTDCLLAFGSNLPDQHPVLYNRLKTVLEEKRKFPIIVVDPRVTMFAQMADIYIPIKPGTDVVLLNAMANVIIREGLADMDYIKKNTTGFEEFRNNILEYPPDAASAVCGINSDLIIKAARMYGKANSALTIWSMGINQSTHASDGVVGICSLSLITGNVGKVGGAPFSITGQCNAMGTREFSSCSGLPGYRELEKKEDREFVANFWNIEESFLPAKRGKRLTEIFDAMESGEIKGLWIIATNPVVSMPDSERINRVLGKMEFVVVQDCYRDIETIQYAHAYLPAALWAEKTGTMTNSERRVNLVNKVVNPPEEAKSDLWIFNEIAKKMKLTHLNFPERADEVFEEIKQVSKGRLCDYSGMTYEKLLKNGGIQWPVNEGNENGMKRLYADGTFCHPDGKAKLIPIRFVENYELPDEQYPFNLNTGRVVEHFHTRTKTGKIGNLNKFSPFPYVEINPDAASKYGIQNMDRVRIISNRGEAVAMAMLTHRVALNSVFMPFHFHNTANQLTNELVDPHSKQPAFKQSAVRLEKMK